MLLERRLSLLRLRAKIVTQFAPINSTSRKPTPSMKHSIQYGRIGNILSRICHIGELVFVLIDDPTSSFLVSREESPKKQKRKKKTK